MFSFISLAWGDIADKILLQAMSEILLSIFSSRIFMVSGQPFKSLIHLEIILMCGVKWWSSFILCMYLSNFPKTIYWINYLQPIVCACFLCQILLDYKGVSLFLGSLFCFIDLCVCFYVSIRLFWLLWSYSIVWY